MLRMAVYFFSTNPVFAALPIRNISDRPTRMYVLRTCARYQSETQFSAPKLSYSLVHFPQRRLLHVTGWYFVLTPALGFMVGPDQFQLSTHCTIRNPSLVHNAKIAEI